MCLDIPSIYAKIWGETKFLPREFPQSGWKAEGVEETEKKGKGKKIGENNGQLRFYPPPRSTGGGSKPPGPKFMQSYHIFKEVSVKTMWFSKTLVQDESPDPMTFYCSPLEEWVIEEIIGRLLKKFKIVSFTLPKDYN